MVEFITEITATAVLAIGAVIAASSILAERRKEQSRVLVPVRARSRRG